MSLLPRKRQIAGHVCWTGIFVYGFIHDSTGYSLQRATFCTPFILRNLLQSDSTTRVSCTMMLTVPVNTPSLAFMVSPLMSIINSLGNHPGDFVENPYPGRYLVSLSWRGKRAIRWLPIAWIPTVGRSSISVAWLRDIPFCARLRSRRLPHIPRRRHRVSGNSNPLLYSFSLRSRLAECRSVCGLS